MPTLRPRIVLDTAASPSLGGVATSRPRLRSGADLPNTPRLDDGAGPHVRLDEGSLAPWSTGRSYRGRIDFERTPTFSTLPTGGGELYMGSSGAPIPGGGTFFMGAAAADLDFDEVGIPMSPGALSKFRVHAGAPPGASNSWTYTVCVNGSPTAMACIVSGASQDGAYDATAVTIADNDKVTIRRQSTQGGGPLPLTMHNWTAIFSPS